MEKIKGGYYIKARCIQDSFIAHCSPCVRETWDYLLREANHKESKYNGFIIKRGQLFRSYREIREGLAWKVGFRKQMYTENQMKHSMNTLMNNGMIQLVSQPRGNLITVLKYELYQCPKNYESTNESTNNQPMNQPTINQSSLPINKKKKNERRKKNNNTTKNLSLPSFDEAKALTKIFFERILENNNKFKYSKHTLETWIVEIERMLRLDNRTFDEVKQVIEFSQSDNFWKSNILSGSTLRKKFDTLWLQSKRGKEGGTAIYKPNPKT